MPLLPQSTVLPVERCTGSPEYLSYGTESDGLFIAGIFVSLTAKFNNHHISALDLRLWQYISISTGNFDEKGMRGHVQHQNVQEDLLFGENLNGKIAEFPD